MSYNFKICNSDLFLNATYRIGIRVKVVIVVLDSRTIEAQVEHAEAGKCTTPIVSVLADIEFTIEVVAVSGSR